jgi:hypothetical protein
VSASCEHGNESLGYIKGEEFLGKFSDYQLLKKDSAPCNNRTKMTVTKCAPDKDMNSGT